MVRNPVKVITRSTLTVIADFTESDHPPERIPLPDPSPEVVRVRRHPGAEFLLEGVRPGEGNIDDLDFLHGTIAVKRGDWQAAIARFRAMLARNPDLPRVRLDLAFAHFQAGEDGRAAHHFRLALGTKDLPPVVRARALAFLDPIGRRKTWSITGDGDGEALRVRSYVGRFTLAISVALGQVGGIDWSTGLTGNCHANRRFI